MPPNSDRPPRTLPAWRIAMMLLSLAALAVSAYLSWHALAGTALIGCGGGSPCDHLLTTRWSSIAGILPVSVVATGVYLALFLATLFIGPANPAPERRLAWGAILVLTSAAAATALWFFIIQAWFVGSFCPYCMTVHVSGVLLAVLALWLAPRQSLPEPDDQSPPPNNPPSHGTARRLLRKGHTAGLSIAGCILAVILALIQLTFTPRAIFRAGDFQTARPALDPHAAPIIGSTDAEHIVTLFFDYNCSHCQRLHSLLDETVQRYHGKLAFLLCPAPLNSQCNPYVAQDLDPFKTSCDLTRIALAVWVVDPSAFPDFDLWMFSPDPGRRWRPRNLEDVRARAAEMVGPSKLEAALHSPALAQYLQTSIQLFGETIQSGNAVPKLACNARWVIANVDD